MDKNIAISEVAYMPASEGSLPHVTPSMIVDCLGDFHIASKPEHTRRVFRWFIAVSQDGTACSIPEKMLDASLLFICSAKHVGALLEEKPSAFAVAYAESNEEASAALALAACKERCLLICGQKGIPYLTLLIQSYFIKILLWENDLKNIALRGGGLDEMLNASTPVLKNFIFVSDTNFSVVSRTELVDPPDELHRGIIKNGCLTPRTIAEKRFRLPEKTFYTRKASSITPYDRVSFPVYINHSYYGSISMSCNKYPDTEGLRDLFTTLVKAITPVCARIWNTNATFNLPSYFFFISLLEREDINDAYLEAQMEMAGLQNAKRFKLILINLDESVEPEKAHALSTAASALNQGNVICFPYKSHMLFFLYGSDKDGELAHSLTLKELDDRVCQPFGVEAGMSSVFAQVKDLDVAYQQARIALGFKKAIQSEFIAGDRDNRTNIYLFEEALPYYLVDPHGKDSRFIRAAFSLSIPEILHKEDLENGTNHVAMLWFWLKDERNATSVAKRLHMHRNTVLYHVGKLEKRFNFTLDKKTARDWLLLSFKQFFLTQSDSSLEKIFADERSEDK